MNRPRVLMLSDVYFPRVNGVATSIQTFRRDLTSLGWPTWLIAPAYPAPWPDDPHTQRVRAQAIPLDPEDRLMSLRELKRLARRYIETVDLVHIQTPFAAHYVGVRLARAFGVKTVETYHTYFEQYFYHYAPFLPRSALSWAARRISRAQCNAVDGIISPSVPMADVLRGYGIDAPIEVIPTGLDLARFEGGDGAAFREEHGIAKDRPIVLHVGRIAFEKNIEFLIDVFADVQARIPDALLVIAGEGPAVGALRESARRKSIHESVLFVGYLERSTALLDCYKSADVFVFASRTETQGLVLLESMAAGTPVVSTAVLGTKDVLGKANPGAIVVPEDRSVFSDAVVRLLCDQRSKKQLSQDGRRYVNAHWSSQTMAMRTVEFYERVLGGTADSPVRCAPSSVSDFGAV